MEPQQKIEERISITDYAAMARELRRMAGEVQGLAARQACNALADQYEELADGVPPHCLSAAAPPRH